MNNVDVFIPFPNFNIIGLTTIISKETYKKENYVETTTTNSQTTRTLYLFDGDENKDENADPMMLEEKWEPIIITRKDTFDNSEKY